MKLTVRRCGAWSGVVLAATLYFAIASSMDAGRAYAKPVENEQTNYYEDALARFNESDYTSAIIQLKNELQRNPGNLSGWILLGRTYLKLGDAVAAEKAMRRARSEGADEALLIVPLANAMLRLKRYAEVLASTPVERRHPEVEVGLQIVRGQAFLALWDLEAADAAFRRAAALRPTAAAPMIGMARLHLARAETEAARRKAKEALAVEPDNYLAWFVDGQVARRRGDRQAALKSFDKSIALEPQHIASHLSRAMVSIDSGKFEDASRDLAFLTESVPHNPFTTFIDALIKAGRKDIPGYQRALAKADTQLRGVDRGALLRDPPLLFLAAIVNFALGNYNDAYNFLHQHIQRNRFHSGSRSLLGRLLLRRGEVREALVLLRDAVELAPKNADLWRLVGITYMRTGRHEEAVKAFKIAIDLKPEEMVLRTVLAMSRLQIGRKDEAVAGLEDVLKSDPDAIEPGIMLAKILLRDRDYEGALRVSREIMGRDPDNPVLHNVLASAQWATGATAEARQNLSRAIALDPNFIAAHRNLARIELRTGSIDAAKARYKAMQTMPGAGVRPLIDLAGIAVREGQLREAISLMSKAREKNPEDLNVQLGLIDLHARAGDRDAALRNVRKLRDRFAENAVVMEKLGRVELKSGNVKDASAAFLRLSKLVSNDVDRLVRVARLLILASDRLGAHNVLKRALVEDAGHLGALAAIVDLESRLGLFDDAIFRTKLIIKQFPKLALGNRLRGDVLARQREFEKAAVSYGAAYRKQPSGATLVRQYLARRGAGVPRPPLEKMESWVKANPKDYATRRSLAGAYVNSGRTAVAIRMYEALVAARPEDPVVLNNLAWLYFEADDPRALEAAETAYRLAPKLPQALDTLGWILVQNGDAARGLKLLRNAYSRASRRPAIRYHLAVALSRQGQIEEARDHLRGVLDEKDAEDIAAKARRLLTSLKDD